MGAGSGAPKTPYNDPANVTAEQVSKEQKISARKRFCDFRLKSGDEMTAFDICFVYGKQGQPTGTRLYNFSDKDSTGQFQTVELSDVLSFSIVDYRRDECLVKLTAFPWISVAELLRQKPSYSDLKRRYTREMRLWVSTKSKEGALLLVETVNPSSPRVVCTFTDIAKNTNIELNYGEEHIWYAIESVIHDSEYPYRVVMKE